MSQVLIVDDDATQLRIRAAILKNEGLTVHVATTVEAALAVVHSLDGQIGVVVTDHHLPGRNGADLVRELRESLPLLPILVLSGMPGIGDQYEGLDVSVHLKPFPPEEFIRMVQSCLAKHEASK
jgi:DNA-binding response OmpR family regulator